MALVKTDSKHYTNIANAIREKIGTTETFTPAQMPDGINGVHTAGYGVGYGEGEKGGVEIGRELGKTEMYPIAYEEGHTVGKAEGIEEGRVEGREEGQELGKQAEYDRFWDAFQNNGNRTNYESGFRGLGWTDETYNPKYPIVSTSGASAIFNSSRMLDAKVSITVSGSIASLFAYSYVQTVPLLIFNGVTACSQAFQNAKYLENITFGGSFGINGLNMQWCPLSQDSLRSLIGVLVDKSADTSGTEWVVTIGDSNYEKLTEEDITNADKKGWVLV